MSFPSPGLTQDPFVFSLYVDDYSYLSSPTPPGSEERETDNDILRITDDGEIRITD